MMKYQGGCLCGAVRYSAEGEPINQRVCHCRLCQKAIGAAFNARLLFHIDAVTVEGPLAMVSSSAEIRRGFCPHCGTTMFSRRDKAGVMGVTSGSLDDPAVFSPDMHIFMASKQRWLVIDDGLPQFEGAPPPA
ncbi:GFA family protein [Mesorhizobium sp. NPDC059025]|uniref:GFA family protein n=1 Tax=unclassified Mesorhizobium TaxID=325217 RepID=UPI00367CAA47